MLQLKPCPFCGSVKVENWASRPPKATEDVHCVFCHACSCEGPEAKTEEEAARLWNMRAPAERNRAAAVHWLAANPSVWSDRPRDDFEAEKAWCMRVLQELCNEGFDLGEAGGLNQLLEEARELKANG
jgi:Lar family restriction alleviation protein